MTKNDVLPRTPTTPKRKKPIKNTLMLVFSITSLAIAAVAFITAQITIHQNQSTTRAITALSQAQAEQWQTISTSQSDFQQQIRNDLAKAQKNIDQLLEQNNTASEAEARMAAEQLIRMAQLQITFTPNTGDAIHLLELAKQQLSPFDSTIITPLKSAIDQDLITLQAVAQIDMTQPLLTIDKIIDEISKIPSIQSPISSSDTQKNSEKNAEATSWKKKLENNLKKLKSLISVRKLDNESDFLLTPDQASLKKQIAITKLVQAQWSILNGYPEIFKQNILFTKTIINQLDFDADKKSVMLTSLDALLKTPIKTNIAITLTALSQSAETESE